MWKELKIEQLDERTVMTTYEAQIDGQRFLQALIKYRNKDGSMSLCTSIIPLSDEPKAARPTKKEK